MTVLETPAYPFVGALINVSRDGQTEMADVLREHLKRIERNEHGVPIRLVPFTRKDDRSESPSAVVIDPARAQSRLSRRRSSISTNRFTRDC